MTTYMNLLHKFNLPETNTVMAANHTKHEDELFMDHPAFILTFFWVRFSATFKASVRTLNVDHVIHMPRYHSN